MASWRREPQRLTASWVGFRQVAAGWPALWHPGPRSAPARQPAARWHELGEGVAQYMSLDVDAAWAELVRYEHLRSETDRQDARRRLWACFVEDHDIADLSSFATIADCGLDAAVLVADEHAGSRALAAELAQAGFRGLLSASAALPGAVNLTLFGGRREIRHDDADLRRRGGANPLPETYIVVQELADDAIAPAHLLERTRLLGDPHRGFEHWAAGGAERARP